MKKITYKKYGEIEHQTIYFDLPECFGCRWIHTTNGNPFTDEEGCDNEIADTENILAGNWNDIQHTEGIENADVADMEYISNLAEAWGLA